MSLIPLFAIIRKDLQLYVSDRRALIMGFVVPIIVASFMGSLFGGVNREPAKILVAIVDEDGSAVSKAIVAGVAADPALRVTSPTATDAHDQVRTGAVSVAVVIPKGFGAAAGPALFGGGPRPELTLWHDPSHAAELGLVRGLFTQHAMESVSREMFSGESARTYVDQTLASLDGINMPDDRRRLLRDLLTSVQKFNTATPPAQATSRQAGINLPYQVRDEAVTSGNNVAYNGYAHSFAGMGIQFLLFAMIDQGIAVLLERQRGLWNRLRSAPISRLTLLAARTLSAAAIAATILVVSFGFAGLVFGVRIHGSVLGFFAICAACALMASTLGLLVASLGTTPGGSRGIASLVVLVMVMLGGAWVPTFVFPAWLQRLTIVMPTRWAIDGLDAMTWRGLGLNAAVMPTFVLLGFALLFGTVAVRRFRWEEGG